MRKPFKKQNIIRTCSDIGIVIALLIFGKIFFDYSPVHAFFGGKPVKQETFSTTEATQKTSEQIEKPTDDHTKTSNSAAGEESASQQTTEPPVEADKNQSSTQTSTIPLEQTIDSSIATSEDLSPEHVATKTEPTETSSETSKKGETLGPNMVGINGIYHPYTQLGDVGTEIIQTYVDSGHIVTALTYFNPSDNQTTYIAGHNPGIMAYFEQNMALGASVAITDSNGNPYYYQAVDRVNVDTDGASIFSSLNMSAIDAYAYGTGQESLLIQYCNSYDGLITMWYLLPQ